MAYGYSDMHDSNGYSFRGNATSFVNEQAAE